MAWLRTSDTVNDHPSYMKLAELAAESHDPRLVGEIRGYVEMLYTWSAQTFSDYKIPYGAAIKLIGLARVDEALEIMERIEIAKDISTKAEKQWQLIDHEGFIHLITSDERTMKAKRRRDQNRGGLVVPVLLRDGDHCRYCGTEVNWKDNKNDHGGTFDHRDPENETTPENFVVSCRACNRARADLPSPDAELPLMEVPEVPVYGDITRQKLGRWKSVVARTCRQMGIQNPLTGEQYHDIERPAPDNKSVEPPAVHASEPSTSASKEQLEEAAPSDPAPGQVDPRLAGGVGTRESDTLASGSGNSLPSSKADHPPQSLRAPRVRQSRSEPRHMDASAGAPVFGNKRRRRRRKKK